MDWHHFKDWLELRSHLDMDALHVHAGIVLQLAAALVLRRSLKSPLPWLAVLAAIVANEAYDLHYEIWPNRGDQWAESIKDGWNTMLMPTLFLAIANLAPRLLTGSGGRPGRRPGRR